MKIAWKAILATLSCSLYFMAMSACSPQEMEKSPEPEPDPGSPPLEAMSLVRYFFFRGGSGSIDTVPLSPGFNSERLVYTAESERGNYAVIPELKASNARISVLLNGLPVTKEVWQDSLPHYSGYVMGQGRFEVTVTDTLAAKQRTYSIHVQGD